MEASSKWVSPPLCSISYLRPPFPPFSFASLGFCVNAFVPTAGSWEGDIETEHFHVCECQHGPYSKTHRGTQKQPVGRWSPVCGLGQCFLVLAPYSRLVLVPSWHFLTRPRRALFPRDKPEVSFASLPSCPGRIFNKDPPTEGAQPALGLGVGERFKGILGTRTGVDLQGLTFKTNPSGQARSYLYTL